MPLAPKTRPIQALPAVCYSANSWLVVSIVFKCFLFPKNGMSSMTFRIFRVAQAATRNSKDTILWLGKAVEGGLNSSGPLYSFQAHKMPIIFHKTP